MVELGKGDIAGVTWMKVPRAYQLGVRIKDGLLYKFTGFREQVCPQIYSKIVGYLFALPYLCVRHMRY